jgi:hypothetical protein
VHPGDIHVDAEHLGGLGFADHQGLIMQRA